MPFPSAYGMFARRWRLIISWILFPSQRNAVNTQQPLQNPGEVAPRRAEHAHHPRAHPKRLQQQPLRVRAAPSASWALLSFALRFCFTLLCFVIILTDFGQRSLVYGSTFLLTVSLLSAKNMYHVQVNIVMFCPLIFPTRYYHLLCNGEDGDHDSSDILKCSLKAALFYVRHII